MARGREGFTITWRIENYDFFFEKPGSGHFSPPFTVDSLKDMPWKLRIVPNSSIRDHHIVFNVLKEAIFYGSATELDFEISFFKDNNPIPVLERTFTHVYQNFHEYSRYYVPQSHVYGKKGNKFILPQTLTIRCRMFEREGPVLKTGRCFARTRIRVEKTAFVGVADRFSNLVHDEERILTIKSASIEKQLFILKLNLDTHFCCKDKLWIVIIPIKENYVKFCTCKVFLIDSVGKKIECGEDKFLFIENEPNEWKFPLRFTKGYLMENNTQFLSNDSLNLKCEFAFSTGIEYNEIEDSEFGDLVNVTQPKFTCALEDLTCLYEEGILCDIQLQTATETFKAHKSILSARSPVFKSMFTTDMKEKTTDGMTIEDLDANTVRRMLKFLYSDRLEDLDWESAKSLYFAADKYNITALKYRCADFLKCSLELSNCCELLLLSDRHQDEDLKKSAQGYMTIYRDAVLCSEQWRSLEKSNPELIIETFRAICLGE